ncbi:MAG: ribosome biogenesis GTPase Der [Lentisphaeria bacterium]|nr:ribosome biogenesis GTPase Der [Lentisphaeria bacterium]
MSEYESEISVEKDGTDLPVVAIVGRPNVGKSAIFNRIIGRRKAIVHEESGVTRDRVAGIAQKLERRFMLIDTGGLGIYKDDKKTESHWDELIREQLHIAIESADKVVFVVDSIDGIEELDREVSNLLRESGKELLLVANKADGAKQEETAGYDFAELGFGDPLPVSCTHNRGFDSFFEELVEGFAPNLLGADESKPLRVTVVGRPNVGKSSIVNQLLGEQRVMVSDISGTTRDAIDVPLKVSVDGVERTLELIDTAGIKKGTKVSTVVDFFSMSRSENAIKRADIVLMIMDATVPVSAMDRKICRKIADSGKACLMIFNKWDLAGKEQSQQDLFQEVDYQLGYMSWADKMTTCALSGYNLNTLWPRVFELMASMDISYSTSLVNRVVQDAVMRLPPPRSTKGELKIYYSTSTNSVPPTFLLFVNDRKRCQANYLQYLTKRFTEAFGIKGMPVKVELRNRRVDQERFIPKKTEEEQKIEKRKRRLKSKRYRR